MDNIYEVNVIHIVIVKDIRAIFIYHNHRGSIIMTTGGLMKLRILKDGGT